MKVFRKLNAWWNKFGAWFYSMYVSSMPENCQQCPWRIDAHCPLQYNKRLTENCTEHTSRGLK